MAYAASCDAQTSTSGLVVPLNNKCIFQLDFNVYIIQGIKHKQKLKWWTGGEGPGDFAVD